MDVTNLRVRVGAAKSLGDRIMKVNHAGEHGAINIYGGQIFMARFSASELVEELKMFRAHEVGHKEIFGEELSRRGQPRCRSYWLCGLGGRLLGLVTGLFGRNAIAATTVAVEGVVLKHLKHQLAMLGNGDAEAAAAISAIFEEERLHHDHSKAYVEGGGFWPSLITPIVVGATEAVIWLGMRL